MDVFVLTANDSRGRAQMHGIVLVAANEMKARNLASAKSASLRQSWVYMSALEDCTHWFDGATCTKVTTQPAVEGPERVLLVDFYYP